MTPFDAYRFLIAMKTHFSRESYDFFENKGRVNVNKESFEKRNDKHRIVNLSETFKDFEIRDYYLANLLDNVSWTPFDSQSKTRYLKFKGYKAARKYHFKREIEILRNYENIFNVVDGNCVILNSYLGGEISIDTFVIVDMIRPFIEEISMDAIKKSLCMKAVKYKPFVKIELSEYIEIGKLK